MAKKQPDNPDISIMRDRMGRTGDYTQMQRLASQDFEYRAWKQQIRRENFQRRFDKRREEREILIKTRDQVYQDKLNNGIRLMTAIDNLATFNNEMAATIKATNGMDSALHPNSSLVVQDHDDSSKTKDKDEDKDDAKKKKSAANVKLDKLQQVAQAARAQQEVLTTYLAELHQAINKPEVIENENAPAIDEDKLVRKNDLPKYLDEVARKHGINAGDFQTQRDYCVAAYQAMMTDLKNQLPGYIANHDTDEVNRMVDTLQLGYFAGLRTIKMKNLPESERNMPEKDVLNPNSPQTGNWERVEHIAQYAQKAMNQAQKDGDEAFKDADAQTKQRWNHDKQYADAFAQYHENTRQRPFSHFSSDDLGDMYGRMEKKVVPGEEYYSFRQRQEAKQDVLFRHELGIGQKLDGLNDQVMLTFTLARMRQFPDMRLNFDANEYLQMSPKQRRQWRRTQNANIRERNAAEKEAVNREIAQAKRQIKRPKKKGNHVEHVDDARSFLKEVKESMKDIHALKQAEDEWIETKAASKAIEAKHGRLSFFKLPIQKMGFMLVDSASAMASMTNLYRLNHRNAQDTKMLRGVAEDGSPLAKYAPGELEGAQKRFTRRMKDEKFYEKYMKAKSSKFVDKNQGDLIEEKMQEWADEHDARQARYEHEREDFTPNH